MWHHRLVRNENPGRARGVTRGTNSRLTPPASGERPGPVRRPQPASDSGQTLARRCCVAEPCEAWGVPPRPPPGRPRAPTAQPTTEREAMRSPGEHQPTRNPKESPRRTTPRTRKPRGRTKRHAKTTALRPPRPFGQSRNPCSCVHKTALQASLRLRGEGSGIGPPSVLPCPAARILAGRMTCCF